MLHGRRALWALGTPGCPHRLVTLRRALAEVRGPAFCIMCVFHVPWKYPQILFIKDGTLRALWEGFSKYLRPKKILALKVLRKRSWEILNIL